MNSERQHFYICAYQHTAVVIKVEEAINVRVGGAQEELVEGDPVGLEGREGSRKGVFVLFFCLVIKGKSSMTHDKVKW